MKLLSLSLPGYSNIQGPKGLPTNLRGGNANDTNGSHLIAAGIQLLLIAAVVFALVVLILSGISWASSGGDKQKLQQARSRIIYAIIGLVISLGALFIVNIVGSVFGVKIFGR